MADVTDELTRAHQQEVSYLLERIRTYERALTVEEAFHHQVRAAIEPHTPPSMSDDDLVKTAMAAREEKIAATKAFVALVAALMTASRALANEVAGALERHEAGLQDAIGAVGVQYLLTRRDEVRAALKDLDT